MENSKQSVPLKAVGIRLWVFLKQNKLSVKQLSDKLLASKSTQTSNKEKISVGFFAKFLKAKVDKKRSVEELKEFAKQMDLDRDGYLGEEDIDAFLKRLNFKDFFDEEGGRAKSKGCDLGVYRL